MLRVQSWKQREFLGWRVEGWTALLWGNTLPVDTINADPSNVDGIVPQIQPVNLRAVREPRWGRASTLGVEGSGFQNTPSLHIGTEGLPIEITNALSRSLSPSFSESGPLRAVHLSHHKLPGINQLGFRIS